MDGKVGNELPWASVFDSTANMRALTAIQAEGLRAASKLVDRFIAAAADTVNTRGATGPSASALSSDERADLWGATDLEPLVKSWFAMVSALGSGSAPSPPVAATPTLDVGAETAAGGINIDLARGQDGAAEIWLDNPSAVDVGGLRLRVSALESDTGQAADAADVRVQPASVDMPARSRRAIDLHIRAGAAPGVYRGNLFTEGHPQLWLPIALTIRDRPA